MSDKIEQNLARAFAEESKASARNSAFALKAEREGYSALARLFRAVADAESIHARRFLLLMRAKIGTTSENLESALQHELRAKQEDYPPMVRDAKDASKTYKNISIMYQQPPRGGTVGNGIRVWQWGGASQNPTTGTMNDNVEMITYRGSRVVAANQFVIVQAS